VDTPLLEIKNSLVDNKFAVIVQIKSIINIGYLNELISKARENALEKQKYDSYQKRKQYISKQLSIPNNINLNVLSCLEADEWIAKANDAFNSGGYNLSIEYCNEAINKDSSFYLAYIKLGDIYLLKNMPSEAFKYYNIAIKIDTLDPLGYTSIGQVFVNQANFQNAILYFKHALLIDNNAIEIYYLIGEAFKSLKLNVKALEAYSNAVIIAPDNSTAHYKLAKAYYDFDSLIESIKEIIKYIELFPNDPKAYYLGAIIYQRQGQFNKAVAFYDSTLVRMAANNYKDSDMNDLLLTYGNVNKIRQEMNELYEVINYNSKVKAQN
jgi:tetratricopeptide (TPR) repeat protein